jgi:hypothetical protein
LASRLALPRSPPHCPLPIWRNPEASPRKDDRDRHPNPYEDDEEEGEEINVDLCDVEKYGEWDEDGFGEGTLYLESSALESGVDEGTPLIGLRCFNWVGNPISSRPKLVSLASRFSAMLCYSNWTPGIKLQIYFQLHNPLNRHKARRVLFGDVTGR